MAKLLIIGGTGFFGKSILSHFIRGGLKKYKIDKIIILARNIDVFLNSHSELYSQDVEYVKGDVANISILPNADYIIHAAASTNLSDYNLSNFKNLEKSIIHFCKLAQLNNSKSKFLYCSSGAVYGKNLSQNNIKENDLFHDDLSQLSEEQRFYCLSKRFYEEQIIKLGKLGLKVSIARCFAFSGKYLPRNQHYALGNFIKAAESGKTIEVKAKHPVIRSYMHADELVESLMQIVEESNEDCPIFNVGSQSAIEVRDLARKISLEYGVDVKMPSKFLRKNFDFYVPNVEKLTQLNNIKNHSLIRELISQNPTVILGSGIHNAFFTGRNILNDWQLLLSKVAQKFNIQLGELGNRKLTYVFEDLISLISIKENLPAFKAENILKKEICRLILIQQENGRGLKLKEKLSILTKSQFISLNVDTLIVDNISGGGKFSNYFNSIFKSRFTLNGIPVFFLNGNVEDYKYLLFGLRSISSQIKIFQNGYETLKKMEKFHNYNRLIIESRDETWMSSFFYRPILIIGASMGEHELGLRYLLNQRKRNFSIHDQNYSPVYIILDKKSIEIPGYREDLNTLGVLPIIFENYSNFWEGLS